jgi:hypothetical protein
MRRNIRIPVFLFLCSLLTVSVHAQSQFPGDALHQPFSELLVDHVTAGQVDYTGIKADPRFSLYLGALKNANPVELASNAEKLAFWINAYNALAIKGIIDGLSPSSFFGRISYFKTSDYDVGGQTINLYDLERDIIIPFNEPRIHFAIVCASYSCPKLRTEAYLAASLEEQLEDNAIDFLNDPLKNNFDAAKKRANLSKIFDWFEKDFEQHSGSVQNYVAHFLTDETHKQALENEKYKVKHLKYQWTLNGLLAN